MIPQATLDTINKALEAEGLSGQLEPPVTPTEDIQKSLARHADKEAVWYADASLVTPAAKRNIMKALGSLGAAVTAYGVLVPTAPAQEEAPALVEMELQQAEEDAAHAETEDTPPAPYNDPADVETSVSVADDLVATASVDAAPPAKPRKVSTIKLDILPADLDTLLNDITVTILCTGFNGDKLNVAYYREVAE